MMESRYRTPGAVEHLEWTRMPNTNHGADENWKSLGVSHHAASVCRESAFGTSPRRDLMVETRGRSPTVAHARGRNPVTGEFRGENLILKPAFRGELRCKALAGFWRKSNFVVEGDVWVPVARCWHEQSA